MYESYLEILREELVPALGCTEPIAIAYATAAVLGMVGGQAERKLEVLEGITEAERIQTAKLLETQFCTCYLE